MRNQGLSKNTHEINGKVKTRRIITYATSNSLVFLNLSLGVSKRFATAHTHIKVSNHSSPLPENRMQNLEEYAT
jgi:hypothetical protein